METCTAIDGDIYCYWWRHILLFMETYAAIDGDIYCQLIL